MVELPLKKNVHLSIRAVLLTSCTLILTHTINTEAQSVSEICPIGTFSSAGCDCMCRSRTHDAPACRTVRAYVCACVRARLYV